MYWDVDEASNYVRFPIEGSAEELASPVYFIPRADLEHKEAMAEHKDNLRANNFDYAPIVPFSYKEYYSLEFDEIHSTSSEQYVPYNEPILFCINSLTEYPFVLANHPDWKSWGIVTPADLNARIAKEYLYSYYAETARAVSRVIEEEYDVEEVQEAYKTARSNGQALKYWKNATKEDIGLHPVEFMSMADLKEVIADNDSLVEQLGFPSKMKCREAFKVVEEYRNRVMHGYRTVISTQEDIVELIQSLERASELTNNAGGEGPDGYFLPK